MKNSAVLAGSPASPAPPQIEVVMPKALKVERAPSGRSSEVILRRDGKPDLQFEGVLLLMVETEPVTNRAMQSRWKKYFLYLTNGSDDRLIVAEEGHSSVKVEVTRYSAVICRSGADAWTAMGAIEELKKEFSAIGFPAIERLGGRT